MAFAYSLALGLLVGLERERSVTPGDRQALGVRTFALIALVGTAARMVSPTVLAVGAVVVGALVVVGYLRTSDADPGTTTEVAAVAVYLLGALCYSDAALALALAVTMTVLLASKSRLHQLVRETLTRPELEDLLKFLVVSVVIFPFLPDRAIGPYGVVNPFRVWSLVVLIASISWLGYIATRYLGPSRGFVATGLASGFVSASAATASMARAARDPERFRWAVAGAQSASVATYVEIVVAVFVVSTRLAVRLVAPALAAAVTLAVVIVVEIRRDRARRVPGEAVTTGRVFALAPTVGLAVLLTTALLLGRWLSSSVGTSGVVASLGVMGFADAHGGSVAAALLFAHGSIDHSAALWTIVVAFSANAVTKIVIATTVGGRRFGRAFGLGFGLSHLVFVAGVVVAALA
ncbi:MAG TPA: DUF4010 domain-containing protein [Acidimicrobiales bacterium]|nr:DUF4010 domain-containing protein [Acidimicrobiales bacterium]